MAITMVYHNDPKSDCSQDLHSSLFLLSHLGQESHWFAVSDGKNLYCTESYPSIVDLFSEYGGNRGFVGIGCNDIKPGSRPSTAYSPYLGEFAVAWNGYLINGNELRERHGGTTDGDVAARYIADADNFERGVENLQNDAKGPFCLNVVTEKGMALSARCQLGVNSLIYGHGEHGHSIATESGACEGIGMKIERDINPAESTYVDGSGLRTLKQHEGRRKLCSFYYPYYQFLDAVTEGIPIGLVRKRIAAYSAERDMNSELLERLIKEFGRDNIIVAPIPDGGKPYAEETAKILDLPYSEPFVKYTYAGRSYDRPEQIMRTVIARVKQRPIEMKIFGKVILIRDDSIRRGTQTTDLLDILRDLGAKELHGGICSPRNTNYCRCVAPEGDRYEDENLAANRFKTDDAMAEYLHFDSLGFIELDDFVDAIIRDSKLTRNDLCLGCYTGDFDFLKN